MFHNGVTDAEYEQLLHRTTALVTLSRAEGYGLPLVEAMSPGTPVIASDIPIFREVGGGAVTLVDPDQPADFAAAVAALDQPGAFRAASEASISRAAAYDWNESARQLVAAAEEVMERRRRVRMRSS